MSDVKKTWWQEQATHIKVLLGILVVLWLVTLLDYLIPAVDFTQYGIIPRKVSGLWGILTAPFLHADWQHLLANTLPLVILGWLTMLRGMKVFVVVVLICWIVSGLGVWALGGEYTHVGASGIIFGLFGYLLLRAYFERSLTSLLIACAVGFGYGGMVWGLLPLEKHISWLGHIFGFAGGALAAWALVPANKRPKKQPVEATQDDADLLE